MEIAHIMKRLDASREAEQQGIKVASDNRNPQPSSDALRNALRGALSAAPSQEKTAAAPAAAPENPAGQLLKLAEDLTNAEEEAMLKQATIYGAAMCDGFMNRFSQYEDAAAQVAPGTKTAAAQIPAPTAQMVDQGLDAIKTAAADPEFVKFANANPDLTKEAFELGYRAEMDRLVKTAQEDFSRGYEDALGEIHKVAAAAYKTGALQINDVLRSIQA